MKKSHILFILLFAFFAVVFININSYADSDEIIDYIVTVDPRTTDRFFGYYL